MDWQLYRRQALGSTLIAMVIVFILWNTPALAGVMAPFRLFVTFMHESGHGLAALASGGRLVGFEVAPNGSGLARTIGGNRALVISAGYLGASLFGALLFYLVNRVPYPRFIAFALGGFLVGFSVRFAFTSPVALAVGIAFGGVLMLLGMRAGRALNVLVLNVLAMLSGLNAVLDLLYLVRTPGASVGIVRNDAAAFAREIVPGTSPVLWAVVWAAFSALMLLVAVYLSVLRPAWQHARDAVEARVGALDRHGTLDDRA